MGKITAWQARDGSIHKTEHEQNLHERGLDLAAVKSELVETLYANAPQKDDWNTTAYCERDDLEFALDLLLTTNRKQLRDAIDLMDTIEKANKAKGVSK